MTFETAQAWLHDHAPDLRVIQVEQSTATVGEAAAALGVTPSRIAKTLAMKVRDQIFLVVASGVARIDNGKCRERFGAAPRFLDTETTFALTGHPVGGVCPFGLATPLPVYLDRSLEPFELIYPAAGSLTSSVEVTPARLFDLVATDWVDVCRVPEEVAEQG